MPPILRGYRAALETYNLSYNEKWVIINSINPDDGIEAIRQWWLDKDKPDCLFCANNVSAMAIIQYLKSLSIPKDIAIVGYSNELSTTLISPSLTTIDQLAYPMGTVAMEKLYSLLSNAHEHKEERFVLPLQLIVRESSGYL